MDAGILALIDKLERQRGLATEEYLRLIEGRDEESAAELARRAVCARRKIYGDEVYVRGLIEVSNYCKNDCYYCGIRRSNAHCLRYRLSPEQIIDCTDIGYDLGFRTFVMQGGEDVKFTDELLCGLIAEIKRRHPDCAVTLSLGERSRDSYQRLFDAGADRYLLRHETADHGHYGKLHPPGMDFDNRIRCLMDLRAIGYQVGCGFMVGSPGQTAAHLAKDLKFIEEFAPDMCGIGPFIPHRDTPFAKEPAGTVDLTCYLLSVIRLSCPGVLLPATTALGTIMQGGRERGILSGANVVMPNLSPPDVRSKYELYNNKLATGVESAEGMAGLSGQMAAIGCRVVVARGDAKKYTAVQ